MVGVEVKIPRTPKYNVDFFVVAALPTMSQRPSMRVLNIVSGGREAEQKLRLISKGVATPSEINLSFCSASLPPLTVLSTRMDGR